MGGGGAGGLAPLSGEALEGAALRAEVVRSGPSGSVAVVLRDPYADGGRALAAALAGRLGWARGAAAGGAQPVPVGKCGFSGAGFFTGADTYRMLFDTRPGYTSIGSSSSAAAGAAGPDARPRSGSESSQEATRLWPLRAVLWPVVRRALQLGGMGAEAAELEQRRAQIERQASQVTRDLPNRRQAIVLKYKPQGDQYTGFHGFRANDKQQGQYHPHLDDAGTFDVLNVSLGNDCEFILHRGTSVCPRVVDHGRVQKPWLLPIKQARSWDWRPCSACHRLPLRSGDVIYFRAAGVVHGVGHVSSSCTPLWPQHDQPEWLRGSRVSLSVRLMQGSKQEGMFLCKNLPRFFGQHQMREGLRRRLGKELLPIGAGESHRSPFAESLPRGESLYYVNPRDAKEWLAQGQKGRSLEEQPATSAEGASALEARLKRMARECGARTCHCGLPAIIAYADRPVKHPTTKDEISYVCGRYLLLRVDQSDINDEGGGRSCAYHSSAPAPRPRQRTLEQSFAAATVPPGACGETTEPLPTPKEAKRRRLQEAVEHLNVGLSDDDALARALLSSLGKQ